MAEEGRVASSFRDPSGFLFTRSGALYRQVNQEYRAHYDALMTSGLYDRLVEESLLIPHEEVEAPAAAPKAAYKVLQPELLRFISYPYEWCLGQFREAALTTLRIQQRALEHGLSLKDASVYNIQFHQGRPVLIDTLSFEQYQEGVAVGGLSPVLPALSRAARAHGAGGRALQPVAPPPLGRCPAGPGQQTASLAHPLLLLQLHLHMQARAQARHAQQQVKPEGRAVSRMALLGLLDSLESCVRGMQWQPQGTEWANYYAETNYTPAGAAAKEKLVAEYLRQARPDTVRGLGCEYREVQPDRRDPGLHRGL